MILVLALIGHNSVQLQCAQFEGSASGSRRVCPKSPRASAHRMRERLAHSALHFGVPGHHNYPPPLCIPPLSLCAYAQVVCSPTLPPIFRNERFAGPG